MINSISLKNFKCFRSLDLQLGRLNVFAGMNGAGKSTVIQSFLMIRQSWESHSLQQNRIQLNGTLSELGTASEVYCANPSDECISIELKSSTLAEPLRYKATLGTEQLKEYFLQFEASDIDISEKFELFQEPFNYLHAERIGPRKAFLIPPDEGNALNVGRFGENAPFIVASDRRLTVVANDEILLDNVDGQLDTSLQSQWPEWMARLFPGFRNESEIYSKADQVRLALALQNKDTGQGLFVRPTNTGFGISFVLGIIVAGLVAQPGTVLIVENPEAHLHPRAQSGIGEFLARVAAGGTQVLVETHSEHVLNGMRRMVKQGILNHEDIFLHYFVATGDTSGPEVIPIPVSSEGGIKRWPEGFFDQLDKDLSFILE